MRDVVGNVLTISMTSLRRLWRCRLVRFWKMSQFSWCRSLKPTARWWFSNTDSSLYMRASSESEHSEDGQRRNLGKHLHIFYLLFMFACVCVCVHSLVLMRNWLETPGWSTSWIAAANRAARISRSVKTAWKGQKGWRKKHKSRENEIFPSVFIWRKSVNLSVWWF